jgi:sulfide:quinone oxidoreductase
MRRLEMSKGPLRVVIAGGGVAALEAVLALRALAPEPLSIEVVAPETEFVYRPLAVAEPFLAGEARRFPLARLVEEAGARLRPSRATRVDLSGRVVGVEGGAVVDYDALLVALGAQPREAVRGALTFVGPESSRALANLLSVALASDVRRIAFAVPAGIAWPLPLYELALLSRSFLVDRGAVGVEVFLVTPEERPLALFGHDASDALSALLEARGVTCLHSTAALSFDGGLLRTAPEGLIEADAVVALPHLVGPRLPGLPSDAHGFVPIDEYCCVDGADVYAAGDATTFPLKQGGIATQQADVAAAAIARRAGSTTEPSPFRPVLRGLLLTGMAPRFLRSERGTSRSVIDTEPLWWPPAKIVGRHLAPFLASKLELSEQASPPPGTAVPVELELEAGHWTHV